MLDQVDLNQTTQCVLPSKKFLNYGSIKSIFHHITTLVSNVIVFTNFLVSHTCKIRPTCRNECFVTLFFNSIRWIQLCVKKNLTFVDCCDIFFLKLVLKNVMKLAKGSLHNIFKTRLIKFYLNS